MFPDNAAPFVAARDLLLRLRTDYDAAVHKFRWPVMERFNWALDYFDHLPPDPLALWCIGAVEEKLSFGELQSRSNQVANYLRQLGVRRGDRVMLLLPDKGSEKLFIRARTSDTSGRFAIHLGDQILLCSDGLHGVVDEKTIHDTLISRKSLDDKCHYLIEAAKARGGPDNITVLLIQLV